MYHMLIEHHWRPRDIIKMEPWECAVIEAIAERHGKEVDKILHK